jgi:hypothetical protein
MDRKNPKVRCLPNLVQFRIVDSWLICRYIHTYMIENLNTLDACIGELMKKITAAAALHDLAAIQTLSRKAAELQNLKEQAVTIQGRIAALTASAQVANPTANDPSADGRSRALLVEVTDGDIRQNLLKLTPHIKCGRVKIGEPMEIETIPYGDHFHTEVCEKGNKLRERGKVGQFYRAANVRAGDSVLLTEVAAGRWTLEKASPDHRAQPMPRMIL